METRDSLGDRMKKQYEDITRYRLPRRTYTIIRLDGKAFHTYTRYLDRPYDQRFLETLDYATQFTVRSIDGAQFAYVQSDEVSILLTDFHKPDTAAWFDGNLQKIVSVSASALTYAFNKYGGSGAEGEGPALFDARAFTIPDRIEVINYFIWRQKDAERNSISMLAQHHASQKQLHGKNIAAQHEVIHEAGDNWNDHPTSFKRGRIVTRTGVELNIPVFTKDKSYLEALIPKIWAENEVETIINSL